MKNFEFPVSFLFKISSISNDFTAKDAQGNTLAYVRQKMLKFKERVEVFSDEKKSELLYEIKADRWLDFSAVYQIEDKNGNKVGKVARKGMKSIWKSHYNIIDQNDEIQYKIEEENPWIKVIDSIVGDLPVVGLFTGYFFNPSYLVIDNHGNDIVRLYKNKSLVGRRFSLEKIQEIDTDDKERILLSLMMMLLLERFRG